MLIPQELQLSRLSLKTAQFENLGELVAQL